MDRNLINQRAETDSRTIDRMLRASCSMHDVTNQTKEHHKRFAREKVDLLRWLDMSGVKDGNTKNCLKQYIQSDSYRHVVSFCWLKKGKNTTKNGKKNLC